MYLYCFNCDIKLPCVVDTHVFVALYSYSHASSKDIYLTQCHPILALLCIFYYSVFYDPL